MADDPFWNYDGAYVLGALSPDQRRRYERHMRRCTRCAAATRELSQLPDLLTRADTTRLEQRPLGAPRRTARMRWYHCRPRLLTAVSALAAALCLITAILLIVATAAHPRSPSAPAPVAMTHVIPAPINTEAQLMDVAWGTRIDMNCTYSDRDGDRLPRSYLLDVIDRAGRSEQIATWRVVPGSVSHISATTNLPRADIKTLQVRTPTGQPVLQLNL